MAFRPQPSIRSVTGKAFLVGVATGLRSLTPLGVMAREHADAPANTGWTTWPVLRSDIGRTALQLGQIGELVGDKLPITPSRLNPGALSGRLALGMVGGIAVGSTSHGPAPRIQSGLAGLGGALVGSYGGYHARVYLTRHMGLPDLPGALAEDVAALLLARKAIKE